MGILSKWESKTIFEANGGKFIAIVFSIQIYLFIKGKMILKKLKYVIPLASVISLNNMENPNVVASNLLIIQNLDIRYKLNSVG